MQTRMRTTGYSIPIPFVSVNKLATTASTSQTVTMRIGRDKGSILKKLYHAVFHTTESKETSHDHSNVDGAKVVSYYTMLDSRRLQDYTVSCAAPSLMKPMIRETPLVSR